MYRNLFEFPYSIRNCTLRITILYNVITGRRRVIGLNQGQVHRLLLSPSTVPNRKADQTKYFVSNSQQRST